MGRDPHTGSVVPVRIITGCALVLAVLFAHWSVAYLIGVGGIFLFRRYGEIVAAGIALDLLYGSATGLVIAFPYIFTIASIIVYIGGNRLKTHLRPYDFFA